MKPKIYIDGKEGTTGLQIYDRLGGRGDIELLLIDEDKRKDTEERRKLLNAADLVFLCLPDAAALEAVTLIDNPRTYIEEQPRIANPGCHATGFISSVYPLVQGGVVHPGFAFTCSSLTGYTGGGKKLIAEYEDEGRDPRHKSHRIYGLSLQHKHLPEMQHICGLVSPPVFAPILGDFPQGMATTVYLPGFEPERIHAALAEHYEGQKLVSVAPLGGTEPVIYASTKAGKNDLELIVSGSGKQTIVTALFDNLGKGASGAAVQNMNLMLGFEETAGLL